MNNARSSMIITALAVALAAAGCVDPATTVVDQNVVTSPTIGTGSATYAPTDPIVVNYDGMPGNPHDWIAVSSAGSPDTSYLQWSYINAQVTGTFSFDSLPAGNYEARAYVDDSYTVLARASFTVAGSTAAAVSTDKTHYATTESITVSWVNLPGNAYDWVAISPAGSPATTYTKYVFTNGAVSGSHTFGSVGVGNWEARAYSNDTYTLLATSTFTVAGTPTVSASMPVYAAGSAITINFSGLPGNQHDWISVATAGSPTTSYLAFDYTGGLSAGSEQFSALPAGSYEARAYLNDTYTLLASSTFTVSSGSTTNPTVSTSAGSYAAGQVVTVNYANLPGNVYDWVAISVAGSPVTSYVQWDYTNGAISGTQGFVVADPGNYEARVYANDSYTLLASSTFTVTP